VSILLVADVSPEVIQQRFHDYIQLEKSTANEDVLLFNDPLRLMSTLRALKGADFKTKERMRRPSNQMRIAATSLPTLI